MEVLHPRCCGLDVHKATVVACVRRVIDGKPVKEIRTFATTTASLIALSEWLAETKCTHVAMEATGVYWKPVWHILSDEDFRLVLANAAHIKNVPGRKSDVKDSDWISDLLAHGLMAGPPDAREPSLHNPGDILLPNWVGHTLINKKAAENCSRRNDCSSKHGTRARRGAARRSGKERGQARARAPWNPGLDCRPDEEVHQCSSVACASC